MAKEPKRDRRSRRIIDVPATDHCLVAPTGWGAERAKQLGITPPRTVAEFHNLLHMYVGEFRRPNVLTWFITLNGASLSTDMAQRVVPIFIKRPVYSGAWEDETAAFINANRAAIIGDILARLKAEPVSLPSFMRWASWERGVLAQLPDPATAQRVVAERQGAMDVEQEEAGVVEEFVAERLRQMDFDPSADVVHIPIAIFAEPMSEVTREMVDAVARSLAPGRTDGGGRDFSRRG